MYPYFYSKKQIPQPVFAKEAMKDNNLLAQNNSKLSEIILAAIEDEMKDMAFYERLMPLMEKDDREIINSILLDETKHKKFLSHIYTLMTGQEPYEITTEDIILKESIPENLSDAILDEAEAVKFYRELMMNSDDAEIRDLLFEIMTDEANHAALGNYLFTKYSLMP